MILRPLHPPTTRIPTTPYLLLLLFLPSTTAIPWPSISPTSTSTNPSSSNEDPSLLLGDIRTTPAPVVPDASVAPVAMYRRGMDGVGGMGGMGGMGKMGIKELFGRGAGGMEKVCGSNVGEDGGTSALTCDDDVYTCFSDSSIRAIGCCRSSNAGYSQCRMHTRCVNEAEHCGDDCINDVLLKKCSSPTPSCATWRWKNGYTSYECDTVSFSADVLSAKEWVLPQKLPVAASTTTSSSSSPISPAASISTPSSAIKTNSAAATAGSEAAAVNTANKTSTTIPIIAGVVVGILLLLILILVVLSRYKKKRKLAVQQQQQQQGVSELDASTGAGGFYKPDRKAGGMEGAALEEMPGDRRLMAAELMEAEIVELPGDGGRRG
ncbi:hypothetical protein BZA77DRAFT_355412 [Pyronema omphalodes]|nr:hypothetical protein BZA77DRAFT_355412 [Pyronema omphalodes]